MAGTAARLELEWVLTIAGIRTQGLGKTMIARNIAYNAVQAGQFEIYVQSFPQPGGGTWQASRGGGGPLRWPASGTELFYYSLDGRLMAVPVLSTQPFAIGSPIPLFSIRMLSGPTPVIGYRAQFDVAKDGRFLMNLPVGDAESPPISVVLNWQAALGARERR